VKIIQEENAFRVESWLDETSFGAPVTKYLIKDTIDAIYCICFSEVRANIICNLLNENYVFLSIDDTASK